MSGNFMRAALVLLIASSSCWLSWDTKLQATFGSLLFLAQKLAHLLIDGQDLVFGTALVLLGAPQE